MAGIVLAMFFVSLPFLVDGSRESFALVDERYEHVARTLGSSRFGAFVRVTFPQAWRGVLAEPSSCGGAASASSAPS